MEPIYSRQIALIRPYTLVIIVIWSLLFMASMTWSLYSNAQSTQQIAKVQAQASFEKDLLYRRWAAMHGGVYVPVTDLTPPNPYLDVPQRDVVTTDGQALTLVNPAYMTRQVYEIAANDYDVRGHITSLDPINPLNAPDAWELAALQAFEDGEIVVSSVETVDGRQVMRYMQAMITEESCLTCHQEQGYALGDVRGGISVNVPMAPFMAAQRSAQYGIIGAHGMLWLLGIVGIAVASRRLEAGIRREGNFAEQLQSKELRYQQMFHEHNAAKLVINPENGRIKDANRAAVRFYGYSYETLVTLRIQDINTLSAEETMSEMARAREQRRNYFAFRHRLANGEIRDVDVFSSPIDTPEGNRLYSIIVDATDKREAERAQQQMVEHLQFLNQTALELISQPDVEAIYTCMGKRLHELFGDDAVIVVNSNIADNAMRIQGVYGLDQTLMGRLAALMEYEPINRTFVMDDAITPVFMTGKLVRYEGGLVKLAQNVLPALALRQLKRAFDISDVYLIGLQKDGAFYAGIQLYMRHGRRVEYPDLIETFVQQASTALQRLQAVEDLRDSEAHLQSILDSQHAFVLRTDLQGRYTYVNDAMYRQFTWLYPTPAAMIGTDTKQTIIEEDWPAMMETVVACMKAPGQARQVELRKPTADGSYKWTLWEFVALTDAAGNLSEFQCVGFDITEHKQAIEQTFELALEKEHRQLLTHFIKHATHEFRTPLTTINSSAYLIRRSGKPDYVERKTYQISEQVARITRLVDTLLLMATLEDSSTVARDPVSIHALVDFVRRRFDQAHGDCQIDRRLHIDVQPDLPPLLGDATHLENALLQLVDNACRYSEDSDEIRLSIRSTNEAILLEVRDEGPGIAPEVLPYIFETFWREDSAHSTPGFGLGLPIARRIISLHNGKITVESVPGAGSTFTIALPVTVERVPTT